MIRNLGVSLIVILAGFVSGCNFKSESQKVTDKDSQEKVTISAPRELQKDTTSFVERLEYVYLLKAKRQDTCNLSELSQLKQIATKLDRLNSKSAQPLKQVFHSGIKSQPAEYLDSSSSPVERWVSIQDSWNNLIRYHERIKNSNDTKLWKKLHNRFNTLLIEDYRRLEFESHPLLSKENEDVVRKASNEIRLCLIHYSCYEYDFSESSIAYFKASKAHHRAWQGFFNAINRDRQVDSLERLASLLKTDLKRYDFSPSQQVSLNDAKELVIKVNLKSLNESLRELLQEGAKLWNYQGYSVKLSHDPEGIQIYDRRLSAGRSFVDLSDRSIHLYGEATAPVVAHELGHVIGFDDHYYSSFDDVSCQYTIEINPGELMSSVKGRVNHNLWQTILNHY